MFGRPIGYGDFVIQRVPQAAETFNRASFADDQAKIEAANEKRFQRQMRNQSVIIRNAASDIAAGRKTPNQVRAELGLPPISAEHTIQPAPDRHS